MEKLYKCITCNYSTKHKSNLYHHNKTKKNIENATIKNTPSISANNFHPTSTLQPPYFSTNINNKPYLLKFII